MARLSRLLVVLGLVAGGCTVSSAGFAHSGSPEEQQACTPDVFRLCAAAIPNEAKIVACLNKKLDKLSPDCRAVMTGQGAGRARPQN